MNWEVVETIGDAEVRRASVPGGYLIMLVRIESYRKVSSPNENTVRESPLSLTFVPHQFDDQSRSIPWSWA